MPGVVGPAGAAIDRHIDKPCGVGREGDRTACGARFSTTLQIVDRIADDAGFHCRSLRGHAGRFRMPRSTGGADTEAGQSSVSASHSTGAP